MFWEQYQNLCQQIGKSPNGVAKELGLSSGTVTFWKNGKIPKSDTLQKIADYFNVTVDQLLNGDPPKPSKYDHLEVGEITFDLGLFGDVQDPYTPEEQLLIQHWRSHPEAQPFVRKLLDMPEPEAKDADVVS